MENKIPYNRFRGEEYDNDGDIFGEMQGVSIEYLQGLSRNELDAIPMAWLYDWAHVTGYAGYSDVQEWLASLKERREKPRALQIPQKQSALVYIGCIDGRNKYYLKHKTSKKVCELYKGFCFVDGKRFTLTDKQMWQFRKTYYKFKENLEKAKNKQDGYHCVTKNGNTVYFKRLPNFEYQFISQLANGDVRQDRMIIIHSQKIMIITKSRIDFDYLGLAKSLQKIRWSIEGIPQIDDDFILFNTDDEYLNKEMKYIWNKATKEDMEYLSSIDGLRRFYKEKEIYDLTDISATKVERVPLNDFKRTPKYMVYLTIDGKEFSAHSYCHRDDMLRVISFLRATDIKISKELKEIINQKIEELPYDEQYDSIKQRGKYFFATMSGNGDNSLNLPNVLNKLGLNYQKISYASHKDMGNNFVVWSTAYYWEEFKKIVLKLNELFGQSYICVGRYFNRKYEVSLGKIYRLDDVIYKVVDTYDAVDVVDALNNFYSTLVSSGESKSIMLGELQKSVGLASSETVNGGYVRSAILNLLMKCDNLLQLEEELGERF